jgi:hypothetical protein
MYIITMGAWIARETFENWFHKHLFQKLQLSQKRGLPWKAVLLLDNAPSHSRESTVTSDGSPIIIKIFLPDATQYIAFDSRLSHNAVMF